MSAARVGQAKPRSDVRMPRAVEAARIAYVRARHEAGMCSQSITCRRKAAPGAKLCAVHRDAVRRYRGVSLNGGTPCR